VLNFNCFISGDASPFDFFRQETSNIDVEIRTEAMKKVAIIAALSGPDKSRSDILAYLQSKLKSLPSFSPSRGTSLIFLLVILTFYINNIVNHFVSQQNWKI
jgi:hypothetical protein